ncbi:glycosyltransferase [Rhizobium sp. AQ_MP]|uniref:glycosyltransferase n=1 Tax=Rhizobium sp. AQ_MP TaxID=2761536 RepID=UPI00163AB612|nr:glycosyltransferase [Rhizobium sp. AQ_MP]MBC2775773.1 glycosyltransferase [Rhizobium sp. AQ_MP]
MKRKPVFGKRPFGSRDARLLLIAYFDPNGIETIPEGIVAWQALSRHEVQLLNLWPGRAGRLSLPAELDLDEYEGVIIHPTISYFPQTVRNLDVDMKRGIADFDGVKMLMKQDEQVHSGELAPLVRDKGFDIIFTCLPESEHEKVYSRAVIGDTCTLIRTLTGYVSPVMRQELPLVDKTLGVTYRGSIQPLEFGRLGYEKRGIGYDMEKVLAERGGIAFDISSRWEDRISGAVWENFLRSSNVVLGVESGSNIFDFDGSVVKWCRDYAQRRDGEDPASYDYYLRAHEEFLHTVEGNVNYAQISPRHFEAAASGAAQLLYEGRYSDLFHAHQHYFPLRKDLGNIDAVMDFLRDDAVQRQMAIRSFEEIILNPDNWYESFVKRADAAIDAKLAEKSLRSGIDDRTDVAAKPSAYILCAHDPKIDPRVNWFAESLQLTHDVTVIGTYHFNVIGERTTTTLQENGIRVIRAERSRHELNWVPTSGELRECPASHARFLLGMLADYAVMPTPLLETKLGAAVAHETELARFRSICEYMVNTNAALLNVIEQIGAPNLVVGVDLEALFAAVACGETQNIPVVFDAHEYWPYSYTDFQHWEIEFWSAMEGRLAALTDINVGVTPQLCGLMEHEYGVRFRNLPNAASVDEGHFSGLEEDFQRRKRQEPLQVLYQGGFAEGRGIEEVLRAWVHVKSGARLILRGPQNDYRTRMMDLAKSLGLSSKSVQFPPAVAESELVAKAREADVGLIAYNPAWFGYRYCCPNQLSQYAAAGLPILSSTTQFVADVVTRNDIGFVVAIDRAESVGAMIDRLSRDRALLVEKGRNSRRFFETAFNWEVLGASIFQDISALTSGSAPRKASIRRLDDHEGIGADRSKFTFKSGSAVTADEEVSPDVLSFECGATVVASSPFFEFPNDAGHLLRTTSIGYAAALARTTAQKDWIEFALGQPVMIDEVMVHWLSEDDRATSYRIMVRPHALASWITVVEETDAASSRKGHTFPRTRCAFLRIETDGYVGQQRMLIRKLQVMKSANQSIDGHGVEGLGPKQVKAPSWAKRIAKRILRKAAGHLARLGS